uniref:Integrator complex subunit 12 n=2 Tax=Cacopsylla melanoneura TaxID=428564 RepID=A0A8D8LRY4_9HEMI
MAVSIIELDDKLVKALKIMNNGYPNAAEQLKLLLDEAIKEKYGASRKPVSVLSKLTSSSSSSSKKLSGGNLSDEHGIKKPKSLPDSKMSKLLSKHTPSSPGSPPLISIPEDDIDMKSDESSQASSDSRGSPGLEIVDDYNKCFVCKNKRCGSGSGNKLIECAECHSSYHQECHTPPISDTDAADPRLIWYCVQCMRTMNKKTSATSLSSKSTSKSSSSGSGSKSTSSSGYYNNSSSSSSKYSSSTSKSGSSSSSSSKPVSGSGATTSSSLISADKRIQFMKKRAASKKPEPPKKGKK